MHAGVGDDLVGDLLFVGVVVDRKIGRRRERHIGRRRDKGDRQRDRHILKEKGYS